MATQTTATPLSTNTATARPAEAAAPARARARRWPPEVGILLVLVGLALTFEVLGWLLVGQSFLGNQQRLTVMILQVSVSGIIAVGATQVIITGGVDLSSGSIVGVTAMVAASLAQQSEYARAVYPSLTGLPVVVPVAAGLLAGLAAGLSTAPWWPTRASRRSSPRSAWW